MNSLPDLIALARPRHWIKNVVVLLPVIFSMQMDQLQAWSRAATATILFCFASSFAYILNDLEDRRTDQLHPIKRLRPLASGRVSVPAANLEAAILLAVAVGGAWLLSRLAFAVIALYVVLQVLYSMWLKYKALVDVIVISIGFVLRAVCGAVVIRVAISPWLFICMFTLFLFMGFCKRYNEVVTLAEQNQAENHRPTLTIYSRELLTHLITLSAGIAVMSFLMYGLSPTTVRQFGTYEFVYTLPLVIYAIFRFAMLSMRGVYADPTDLILRDRPFQVTAALWLASAIVIVRWGEEIQRYVEGLY